MSGGRVGGTDAGPPLLTDRWCGIHRRRRAAGCGRSRPRSTSGGDSVRWVWGYHYSL